MTLGKDGGRLSRLDSSGSNKTVWNKHSCKRCRMFVRSTVRCTEHPDDPGSVQVLPKLTRQGLLRAWQLGNTAEWQRKVMNSSSCLVKNHKTDSTHGSARIVFSPRSKSWMDVFLKVRLKFATFDCGPEKCVLLYSNGESTVSSQINKAIKSVWKRPKSRARQAVS